MPVIFGVPISKCSSFGEVFDKPVKLILYVVLRKEIWVSINLKRKDISQIYIKTLHINHAHGIILR
jgi:hypothetical protein